MSGSEPIIDIEVEIAGGGGESSYSMLSGKPQINGHELKSGDNTLEELGINPFSTAEKNKLSGIDAGAQVNKIEVIKHGNKVFSITNKTVDLYDLDIPEVTPADQSDSATQGFFAAMDFFYESSTDTVYLPAEYRDNAMAGTPAKGKHAYISKAYLDTVIADIQEQIDNLVDGDEVEY